jgi:hypothetical protein
MVAGALCCETLLDDIAVVQLSEARPRQPVLCWSDLIPIARDALQSPRPVRPGRTP